MTLQEEIQNNAGLSDTEYLNEGIMFFKNSTKIKRLSKNIERKKEKLLKKGDVKNADSLSKLILELNSVYKKFEEVEIKFKSSKGKDNKNNLKKEYANLEKSFNKLLIVAKKDSTKKALIACGGLAVMVGVLAAGAFGMMSLYDTGTLSGAATNVNLRTTGSKIPDVVGGNSNMSLAVNNVARTGVSIINRQRIQSTNKDLMTTATVAGATAAGVLSAGVIQDLRDLGRKDKTLAATVNAIEGLKSSEKSQGIRKDSEGDEG